MSLPIMLLGYIRLFLNKLRQDAVSAYSAQAVFFIVLSFFPFIMFLLTLLQYLPISQEDLMNFVAFALPDTVEPFVRSVMSEIYTRASGSILSISAVVAIWSAGRGMLAIIRGLNAVNDINETRGYISLRIIACCYTLILVILLVVTLGFLVFGNQIVSWMQSTWMFPEGIALFVGSIRALISFGIFVLFFLMLFLVIPNRKSTFFRELPGALLTGIGWTIFSFLFSFYVDHTNSFSVYGSLTSLVVLMLWLYACMNIMFIGAEINVFFHTYHPLRRLISGKPHKEIPKHG